MKILITTGIYPPAIGGPAKYAKNLKAEWEKAGHKVTVKYFTFENKLPTGLRHLIFMLKIIPSVMTADLVFALDTFSVGFPSVLAAKFFGDKIIIRTGGDFLWEWYVERTGEQVLLKDFYETTRKKWTLKEKITFLITKWTMNDASAIIFSTTWQRDIFTKSYNLNNNISVIENYYGPKVKNIEAKEKNFMGGTRKLKWKNLATLAKAFEGMTEAKLDVVNYSPDIFAKKMAECYGTILVSLGDISPNMILESISLDKPFIITEENGLMERIKDIAITVNPKDADAIKNKILWLCNKENYDKQVEKIKSFNFTHNWEEIAKEILELSEQI